jgi:hypothetical protein
VYTSINFTTQSLSVPVVETWRLAVSRAGEGDVLGQWFSLKHQHIRSRVAAKR